MAYFAALVKDQKFTAHPRPLGNTVIICQLRE